MASKTLTMKLFSLLVFSYAIIKMATASDPDILTDFLVPKNFSVVFKASLVEFPALEEQSVSYAVLEFANGTTNPPHIHPRSAELLYLVGPTSSTLTLQTGDMLVFPKGLVHFQYNADSKNSAIAISAFESANAGTVSLPNTLFATGINDTVLAKSFKTDVATIQALKDGLVP
ncbi:hypothetical protein I3843_14G099500 [Carya illinoinensis]|uniref:Cupin type-1 domain-containing protein n=1 Tax=Carya illinoinensis TaxID=32201 RepID=A0A8T1NLH3_CARIL|nr:hypothetical protein CIPAW_14G098900 [Carya illinoinensis]KAG6678827.1 hypothetical protein I3842_14G101300 [Carya illinoinensis]KAG7947529.1 hypothetical protein I3843_14G099500 [Carya illinoinensis]